MARLAKRRSSGSESDDEGSGSVPPSDGLIPHLSFEVTYHLPLFSPLQSQIELVIPTANRARTR